ncbi:unnamed protein product, partial [Ranitomeya imitator]
MRSALSVLAVEEEYIDYPMTASMRSRLVKTAPPAYKAVILTLTVAMTGEAKGTPSNSTERVSRREMFQALLKAGVSKESIDGKQTGELWKLYKQKVLSAKK